MSGRFFTTSDPAISTLDGKPIDHWSRRYEYAWALTQIRPREVVLDAGCGVEPQHVFKYALAERSERVYAVDGDPAVLGLPGTDRLQYIHADLASTGLPGESIDTVYCLSVLEHVDHAALAPILDEFARILRPGGRVVLSIDLPVDGKPIYSSWLGNLDQVLGALPPSLQVEGPVEKRRPPDAICHEEWRLNVFRLVLTRTRPKLLIASPVRQEPEVFQAFLQGLANLDTTGFDVDYWLAFHNCWDTLEPILRAAKPEERARDIYVNCVSEPIDYERGEDTHRWSVESIQFVAALKNAAMDHARGRYDAILNIDSDTLLHPGSLQAAWAANKDALWFTHWTRWEPGREPEPNVWDFHPYTFYPDSLAQFRTPGLHRIGGGGGSSLIRTRCLHHPYVNWSPVPGLPPSPLIWQGEDRQLAVRLAVCGCELWADTRYPALHIYRSEDLQRAEEFLKGDTGHGLRAG